MWYVYPQSMAQKLFFNSHLGVQSEYIAPSEKRRGWISGFTGSAGTAVITTNNAALWTDGRYFLQADQQLDCNWILMRTGIINTQLKLFYIFFSFFIYLL